MAHNKRTTINVPPDLVQHIGLMRRRMSDSSFNDCLVMLARRWAVEEPLASVNETLERLSQFQDDVKNVSHQDKKIHLDVRRSIDLISQLLLTFRFFLADIHEEDGKRIVEKARKEHLSMKEKTAAARRRTVMEKDA